MNKKNIIHAFLGTASIQMLGRGFSVLVGIVMARGLGPEKFGTYSFIMSIIVIASLPVLAGMNQLIIREVSLYRSKDRDGKLAHFLDWSCKYVVISSSFIVVLMLFYSIYRGDSLSQYILLASLLIPLKGIISRVSSIFNGFEMPVIAQLSINIIVPCIVLMLFSFLYFCGMVINLTNMINVQIVAYSMATLFILYLSSVRIKIKKQKSKKYSEVGWYKSLIPFSALVILSTLTSEIAIIALGLFSESKEAAFFRVAIQAVALLSIGLQAVNTVTAPKITRYFKQGNIEDTQNLLDQSVRISFITLLPIAILLVLFGDFFIIFLFGKEYLPTLNVIYILMIGQIFNVCIGSVGLVLNMTGYEKKTLKSQIITLILTLFLLALLTPTYGSIGAAIAISSSLIVWNVLMVYDVYNLVGLKTWLKLPR